MSEIMDLLISWVNGLAALIIAIGLTSAILSKRVKDGLIIKLGLFVMAIGFLTIAYRFIDGLEPGELIWMERALLFTNSGLAIVIFGYIWRKAQLGHNLRRSSDWADFESTQRNGE